MKRYILGGIVLLAVCSVSQAQQPIERILESVAANNKGIKAVQEQAVADRAALSAANSLEFHHDLSCKLRRNGRG